MKRISRNNLIKDVSHLLFVREDSALNYILNELRLPQLATLALPTKFRQSPDAFEIAPQFLHMFKLDGLFLITDPPPIRRTASRPRLQMQPLQKRCSPPRLPLQTPVSTYHFNEIALLPYADLCDICEDAGDDQGGYDGRPWLIGFGISTSGFGGFWRGVCVYVAVDGMRDVKGSSWGRRGIEGVLAGMRV